MRIQYNPISFAKPFLTILHYYGWNDPVHFFPAENMLRYCALQFGSKFFTPQILYLYLPYCSDCIFYFKGAVFKKKILITFCRERLLEAVIRGTDNSYVEEKMCVLSFSLSLTKPQALPAKEGTWSIFPMGPNSKKESQW